METKGRFYVSVVPSSVYSYLPYRQGFVEVAGYTEPFDDYKVLDLFLHREIEGSGWCVSEGKTGLRVGRGETALEACIVARELLSRLELCSFMDSIEAAIKTTGLSPRYAGAGEPAAAAAPHPPSGDTSSAEIMEGGQHEGSDKIMGPSSDLPGCG